MTFNKHHAVSALVIGLASVGFAAGASAADNGMSTSQTNHYKRAMKRTEMDHHSLKSGAMGHDSMSTNRMSSDTTRRNTMSDQALHEGAMAPKSGMGKKKEHMSADGHTDATKTK